MAIRFFSDENITFRLQGKRNISKWLDHVAVCEGKSTGVLCYNFVSDEKILEMNKAYLQHNYHTDIITFNYNEGNTISGEMYISTDTVRSNAETFQTTFHNELLRVMVHGLLHLCGYKDETEKEQAIMRTMEDKYLASIAEFI